MEQKQSIEQFKGRARLPSFAIPKHYDLHLKLDLSACTFSGTVQIHLSIVEETKFLVMNALELDVHQVWFTNSHGQKYHPCDVVLDGDDEFLVLVFDKALGISEGVLGVEFSAVLNAHLKGLYKCTYLDGGEKKNMAVTQFEAVDARRCFPCWDEPALKATFKIALDVPSELTALSNMPVVNEQLDGDVKTVYFEESPIMSTYLVAVVVGLFDYIEDTTSDGVKVRAYCPVGNSDKGEFALNLAVKTLDLFSKYFSTPYSLPKLDMVAVPEFSGGAMENYGLITYRENELLFDHLHSTAARKQRFLFCSMLSNPIRVQMAIVVSHEVAHQWFGNLVTMEWWTDLWLNEGFATWISYLATDILFPEWKVWSQFLQETTGGLVMDALEQSHPIQVEVNHARSVLEIFDAISYKKGSAVIRMLQAYLGDDIFQKSLSSYMKRFSGKNAKTEDLWSVLSEESGVKISEMMDDWTKKQGYPVISVKAKDHILEFEQAQFLSAGLLGDDTRAAAYIAVMRNASSSHKEGFEALLNVYREAGTVQEKERILRYFASSPDPDTVLNVLNFFLCDEVRDQDIVFGLCGISLECRETAWKWMKENWDLILTKYGAGMLLTRFVRDIVTPFCSNEKAAEVEEFFASRVHPSIAMTLKQSIEKVRIKARWVQGIRQEQSIQELVKQLAGKK